MKTKLSVILTMLCICIGMTNCKKDTKQGSNAKAYTPNFTLAKTNNELKAVQDDPKANIIRNLAGFDAMVTEYGTALNKLSAADLSQFRSGLVVREGVGVVSFDYSTIAKSLNYDDFAEVLSMFGLDAKEGFWGFSKDPIVIAKLSTSGLKTNSEDDGEDDGPDEIYVGDGDSFADHPGYMCMTLVHHTCKKAKNNICLSGC